MRAILLLSLIVAGCAARQDCGDRADMLDRLDSRFGETVRMSGDAGAGALVETFASHESGSFTTTISYPDGRMCLLAAGYGYAEGASPLPAP